jgi:hypothetical protein
MAIKSLHTTQPSAAAAAAELKHTLSTFNVKMLVYFASWEAYDPHEISAAMHGAFPGTVVFGCSSHAELYNGETLTRAVSAMAFDENAVSDACVVVMENLSARIDAEAAFAAFDAHFGVPMATADYRTYGGMILIDGLTMKEETLMGEIGSHTNIMFTGGSASDALAFKHTHIYANGRAYADAALLAVFKTTRGIDIIKTQSVDVLDTVFTITKADTDKRTIYELDGRPAAQRYAEALGVNRAEIDSRLFTNPVGLVIDNDVYIRSCMRSDGDALVFYCNIHEDTQVNLLSIRDVVPDTRKAVEDKIKEVGNIAAIVDFRCVLRTLQLNTEDKTRAYAEIFNGIPAIGFSTYGEQLHGHINQTSTMMVFK